MKYNFFIETSIHSYLLFILVFSFSLLNFQIWDKLSFGKKFQLLLSLIIFFLLLILPVFYSFLLFKFSDKLVNKKVNARFGFLWQEIQTRNKLQLLFYPFYIFRRIAFVFTILVFYEFSLLQFHLYLYISSIASFF